MLWIESLKFIEQFALKEVVLEDSQLSNLQAPHAVPQLPSSCLQPLLLEPFASLSPLPCQEALWPACVKHQPQPFKSQEKEAMLYLIFPDCSWLYLPPVSSTSLQKTIFYAGVCWLEHNDGWVMSVDIQMQRDMAAENHSEFCWVQDSFGVQSIKDMILRLIQKNPPQWAQIWKGLKSRTSNWFAKTIQICCTFLLFSGQVAHAVCLTKLFRPCSFSSTSVGEWYPSYV